VFVLGIPTEDATVKSLGTASGLSEPIASVKLLGTDEQIKWIQGQDSLVIGKTAKAPAEGVIASKVTLKS